MSNPSGPQSNLANIIIPVLGITGAEKSTFINSILGDDSMFVGNEQDPCTSQVEKAAVDLSKLDAFPLLANYRVFLVDTPGFDNTEASVSNTPESVKKFLDKDESCVGCEIGGAIYLQDITFDRLTNTEKKNFKRFADHFGEVVLSNTIIGLTKTDRFKLEEVKEREARLKNHPSCKYLIDKGALVLRARDASAELLNAILKGYCSRKFPPREIIIPVMGATGSGRSTFINSILGENKMEIGTNLESCTKEITPIQVESSMFASHEYLSICRLTLVDTPGLGNPDTNDLDVINKIATYLKKSACSNTVLGGVVYLQDISIDQGAGASKNCLDIFKQFYGTGIFKHVVLGATKGERLGPPAEATKSFRDVKEKLWKGMIEGGALAYEITRDVSSPETQRTSPRNQRSTPSWKALDAILERFEASVRKSEVLTMMEIGNQTTSNIDMLKKFLIILRSLVARSQDV